MGKGLIPERAGDGPGNGTGDDPGDGYWLTVAAAARQLGITSRAIRGRIKRDTIAWKPGNTGKLVLIRPGDAGNTSGDGPGDAPGNELQQLRDVVDQLREELMEARLAQVRTEGEATALRDTTADLRSRLDRAEAQLADARRPWWRRLFPGTGEDGAMPQIVGSIG